MKNKISLLFFACLNLYFFSHAIAQVGAVAGSSIFTISGGSPATPTYKIVSASAVGDPVYSGVVDSVVDSDTLSFATSTDEDNNSVNPFYAAGSFQNDVQVPELTASVSGGAVSAITITYGGNGGFITSRAGFDNAPQILISSGEDDNVSTATSSINSDGKITSVSVDNGGSGYTSAPDVSVVGGPHLLRITDTNSSHYGRVFLITNNTQTTLDLDFSVLASGETGNTSTFFAAGTEVEVVKAATLGNIFGIAATSLDSNWQTAPVLYDTSASDWVYIWDPSLGGYGVYHFVSGSSRLPDGWYGTTTGGFPKNNLVIYPDEAFIVARRSSGDVQLEVEGAVSSDTQKILLPATNDQMLCNNPYGMDLLLAEIIPSTAIGSSDSKFRPGTTDDGSVDYVTIMSGQTWKKFWYKSTDTNSAVTSMMEAGSRAGTGTNNALQSTDILIATNSVSDLQSCSDAAGSSIVANYNDGNYTKVSLNGSAPGVGFTITFSDIQGYMLNDAGTHEVNATTGENVDTNGTGSVIYSNIDGSFEVVGSGSGYVVIEKQRNVNFKSNEGSPTWAVGTLGAGYTNNAQWWAVGGNNGTTDSNASGEVSTAGAFSFDSYGSGYTSAPQIVISGGGWRLSGGDDSSRGNDSIGASDGLIISRRASGGVQAFIEPLNPSN
jgi:hypothetical protein